MSAMTVWREYDLRPGAPNYEGVEILQNIHSTWMWGAHLDVRTHPCVQATLRACSGHESLTGEYLLSYFTAPSILAAARSAVSWLVGSSPSTRAPRS